MGNYLTLFIEELTSNTLTLHIIYTDVSGSMEGEKERYVRETYEILKENLMKLEDKSSTRIALIGFGRRIYHSNFETVENFDTNYSCKYERTVLYDAICDARNQVEHLIENYRTKCRLNINVIFLSDGKDNQSYASKTDAMNAVKQMREKFGAATIFYAIEESGGMDELTSFARELGFDVRRVENSERSMKEFSRQVSTMLTTSSRTGQIAKLGNSLDATLSQIAAKEFGKSIEQAETEIVDPFDDIFNED